MTERILTLHPEGKEGVNIEKVKYDQVKSAILETLQGIEEMSFNRLGKEVKAKLSGSFEGSVSWYYTTVKLDLEARGLIERIPDQKPQLLRLTKK
jgi:hypothetical protein